MPKGRCKYWDNCNGSDEEKVFFCVNKGKKIFKGCRWNFRRGRDRKIFKYEPFMDDPLK